MSYTLCKDSDGSYHVVKWEDGKVIPEAEYIVSVSRGRKTCSCPSGRYRGYCKHTNIVNRWISMGEPIMTELEI